MRHRSGLRCVLGAVVVACALTSAGPAGATTFAPIPVPADAPTVATSPSGATVLAWILADGRLCTAVQLAGAPRPVEVPDDGGGTGPGGPASDCWPMRIAAAFDAERSGSTDITPDRDMTWGWAGAGVATVELRRHGALFGTGPATPSPLTGVGAGLRFFAIEHAPGPRIGQVITDLAAVVEPDEIVLRDASGTARRADDLIDPRPVDGPVLQRGRDWVLGQTVTRPLAPTPLNAERRETRRCLRFVVTRDSRLDSGPGLCDGDPDDGQAYLMQVASSCFTGPRLEILVREPARRVVAIFGDGRRRAVPLAALSPGTRAGTLLLRPGIAVRRALALSATGKVLLVLPLNVPPSPRGRCYYASDAFYGRSPSPAAPPPAGPHALRVTDHGERICVAADRAPRVPQECALPPVDPYRTRVTVRRTPTGRAVFGVALAEIAAVRVTRGDGSTQTVATTPVAGYAGIYAAVLRQVLVALPGDSPVADVAALDARGRVLTEHAGREVPPLQHPRVVLRVPGVPPLQVGEDVLDRPSSCLWLGSDSMTCMAVVQERGIGADVRLATVEAGCAPRRIVVVAVLRRRADRLVVRTASGREVIARRVRIPAGSGPASGLYAQLAVVGPHDGIRAIVQRGRVSRSVPAVLPPAARQCGYVALPGLN